MEIYLHIMLMLEKCNVKIEENKLSITPENNFNGNIDILVEVTDGLLSDSLVFPLEVLPINDNPVLAAIDSQSINEDSFLRLLLSANDVDGDLLTYNADAGKNATVK